MENNVLQQQQRVLHVATSTRVTCKQNHQWDAVTEKIAIGQLAVCGQGVTERVEYTATPSACPTCAQGWHTILSAVA